MNQPGTIGIIGGGQLGRMLTLAALPLGFKVVVIDPVEHCPAAQVGAEQIVADLYDQNAHKQLAEKADYITIEIEHFDTTLLDQIVSAGTPVNPGPETIRLIQDKFAQKQALRTAGIPVADFVEISDQASAEAALETYGGKMLLKTRRGAYDGRGNMVVRSKEDIQQAFELFKDQGLYAEKFIPFQKELAVMVARGLNSTTVAYPVVETVHDRNICIEVLAPAQIDQSIYMQAENIAMGVARFLQGAGVFGIEMFLNEDNQILVNEIAPRVHNSGHYTMEACRTSQFEQHIRAISGLPLGATDLTTSAAVMVNILGERDGPVALSGLEQALNNPYVSVHLYGKGPTKIDRKMGHLTATGATVEQAKLAAWQARKSINI